MFVPRDAADRAPASLLDATAVATDPGEPLDRGEVFTRRWVVELILDLIGYTADRDLGDSVLVEPACGTGAFLVPVIERLLASTRRHGRPPESLGGAIRAFDVIEGNTLRARRAAVVALRDAGVGQRQARALASRWIRTADFLLQEHARDSADFVVGNPPYIRLENIPPSTMRRYRANCATMLGRSDIYVGFIEQGLALLRPGGRLGVICADRWMHNQYGAALRHLITSCYAVDAVISMHDVDAFERAVSAYPAIVIVRNGKRSCTTVVDTTSSFGPRDAARLHAWTRRARGDTTTTRSFQAAKLATWFRGRDLWPSTSPARLAVLADLERRFPPLEDARTGTRVGIGVATGCDPVYITTDRDSVEEERLLPLLRAGDTRSGCVTWSGAYLVNPWDEQGLVDLRRYPRLRRYLEAHRDRLGARHVARQRPRQWYRTIDRVHPGLRHRPKLVLPDLKASAHPVLDVGDYYPHHNLYFIVSERWDLEALGGLLLSDVANLFVGSYCVKMRGGCYRFQAQYLRRIRVPEPASVRAADRRVLARAFRERDVEAATQVALRVYGLAELPDGQWSRAERCLPGYAGERLNGERETAAGQVRRLPAG